MSVLRMMVILSAASSLYCAPILSQEIGGGTPHQTILGAGGGPAPIVWVPIEQDSQWTYFIMKTEVSCGQFKHCCPEHFDGILKGKGVERDTDPWSEDFPVRRLTSAGIADFLRAVELSEGRRSLVETKVDLPTLSQWRLAATTGRARQNFFVRWAWTPERQMELERALQREDFVDAKSELATRRSVDAGKAIDIQAPAGIQILSAKATYGRVQHKPSQVTYQADAGFSGFDLIQYSYKLLNDESSGWQGSGECFIAVQVPGQEVLSSAGEAVHTGEINAINLRVGQPPAHGEVNGPVDDRFIYLPRKGFIGEDSFVIAGEKDGPWTRTYRVTVNPSYVNNGTVETVEDASNALFSVFDAKHAEFRAHANVQIQCREQTLLGGILRAAQRHYFDPGEVKDTLVEITCTPPNGAVAKRLRIKVGNPKGFLSCQLGESLSLHREREKPELDVNDTQLALGEVGEGINQRWEVRFTPARSGEHLVRFTVPESGDKTYKVFVSDDADDSQIVAVRNGEGKLFEDAFSAVTCDQGSMITVPVLEYTPGRSVVSSGGFEILEYAIVSPDGGRLEVKRSCKILAKESSKNAQRLLWLRGIQDGTHVLDAKGEVVLKASASEWIKSATIFVDQSKTPREELLNVLRRAIGSGDNQSKLANELLAHHVRQIVSTNKNGYVVLQPVGQAGEDVNPWTLEHLQGNVPEVLRLAESPTGGDVNGDKKTGEEFLVKGKLGSTEGADVRRLLLDDDGEKVTTDERLRQTRAGMRLVKKVRLASGFEQALTDVSKHAFDGDEAATREILNQLKDLQILVSQLSKASASSDAKVYRGYANDFAALLIAKTQYEAGKSVDPQLVAPVQNLSDQLGDPFFRHFASLLSNGTAGDERTQSK